MMGEAESFEDTCENCRYLDGDDVCGNPESVYYRRTAVFRDGDEVLQTGWCDRWAPRVRNPS